MQLRRGWSLCIALVLALLCAQTLGLAHGVAHPAHGPAEEEGVFAGHEEESECRLFDAAATGDLLPPVPSLLTVAVYPPPRPTPAPRPAALPRLLRASARGPPSAG
jgi:hypothetical protein